METKKSLKNKKFSRFNYSNVKLAESRFKNQFSRTLDYYYKIPDDSLLYGFRKRAGLKTPGRELYGWYGAGLGNIFGQIIGSYAKMYASTNDIKLKNKNNYLVEEWAKCLDEDGYFYYNPKGHVLDPHYEYEKILGGLLDSYEYAQNDDALKYLNKITDWAIKNLSRNVKQIVKMPYRLESNEWYTLSENLYRAYELTSREKYKEFAREWEYEVFWDKFLNKNFLSYPKHAYSHVNSLNGAARAFIVKGDNKYRDIIENAYDIITKKQIYCTGGYGPREVFFSEDGYLGESLIKYDPDGLGNAEIPCGTWAVFKLCGYLMEITGDAKYADWVEKLLYNGIGAELLPADNGNVMYYANYHLQGAQKTNFMSRLPTVSGFTDEWPCCCGTYPQDVTEYFNLIYFHDNDGIYISQYIPSSLEFKKNNQLVNISIDTMYPEENEIDINIETKKKLEFKINLRIPNWVIGKVSVMVNGQNLSVNTKRGEWLSIKREWTDKDRIKLILPMALYFSIVDEQHPDIVALNYGPIVLSKNLNGILTGDIHHPDLWIKKVDNKTLEFETQQGKIKGYPSLKVIFKPFYSVKECERYYIYNRSEGEWNWLGGPVNFNQI